MPMAHRSTRIKFSLHTGLDESNFILMRNCASAMTIIGSVQSNWLGAASLALPLKIALFRSI
jgi:hypothetical protein